MMGYVLDFQESIKQGPLALFPCACLAMAGSTAGCLMAQQDQDFQNSWIQSISNGSHCLGRFSDCGQPTLVREKLLHYVHIYLFVFPWWPFFALLLASSIHFFECKGQVNGLELAPAACRFGLPAEGAAGSSQVPSY